ncbi:MAG: UDP-N-acetylmuramoyl-L-alanine--D-glutamate ligase [Hyphomicrobiaceae bacterium]
MIRALSFAGRHVAVFGLGISGTPTVKALLAGGARVAAWDDSAKSREAAKDAGLPVVDLNGIDFAAFDALVLAPGVPLTHPTPHWTVVKAQAAEIEIIGDIEIFARERQPNTPFIAVTGTNGKSTTTALITHLLRALGLDVQMGGNIGTAVLALEPPAPDRLHVIEMSSFQIDLTPTLRPTVGVLLNVTPDHIDRHGTLEHYAAVKERLVEGAEAMVIGLDDAITRDVALHLAGHDRLYPFTTSENAPIDPRFHAAGTKLMIHETSSGYTARTEIADLVAAPNLRGRHNVQNALAALTAIRALHDRLEALGSKIDVWRPAELAAGLATFPGLVHRMEDVGSVGRVRFINDSKATNADSTGKALAAFGRGIFWVLGGKAKDGGIEDLKAYFPGISKAYLIGAASDQFAATLEGHVAYERSVTLDVAVAHAARDAAVHATNNPDALPIVLLSPACASYDQFRSFEHRGDVFRDLVAQLPGHRPKGRAT